MTSRWIDADALAYTITGGGAMTPVPATADVALRLYAARLLGCDASLVLHGGGNVSVKGTYQTVFGETVPALFIKASGRDLATLDVGDLCPVDLARATALCALSALDDEALANALRLCLLDSRTPTPSIETPMHAVLPHKFVDHSHADVVTAITNREHGASLIREALGDRVAVVPYVRPGLALAKAVADAYEQTPDVEGIVLMNHGLVTFGPDAKTSYERHLTLTNECEVFLARKAPARVLVGGVCANQSNRGGVELAPKIRGLLARRHENAEHTFDRSILDWRAGDALMAVINGELAASFCESGPLTGDHLIRTKARYAYVPKPQLGDRNALDRQLAETIARFAAAYRSYLADAGETSAGDVLPQVVVVPGVGLFAQGTTLADARITADIAESTLLTKARSHGLGPFVGLTAEHLRDMELRPLQVRKMPDPSRRPLTGQVVLISGGGGAIGCAIGETCAEAGAHVALADVDRSRLDRAVARINAGADGERAFGVPMDVTDEHSVRSGYDAVVRQFGGVDVVVANAGVAHVAPIETLELADFQRVMSVNASGYLLVMREGIRVLKRQGLGGSIVINASKNVFAPGAAFGAYSASKAAGHQLGKVAAIELAGDNIRVNMINADAVFGDAETSSGLWDQVGPDRARARGLAADALPEFYRQRSLLKVAVTGRHVGHAVVFFASHATPTTGATLPVDGGVADAFPR